MTLLEETLYSALLGVAICDQDERPLNGDDPFDWRRRSMKQEELAREALRKVRSQLKIQDQIGGEE